MIGILGSLVTGIGGKILGAFATKACDVVDQLVEDKDLAGKLKFQITQQSAQIDVTKYVAQLEAQKSVLVAEIQGESWLQRNWRPMIMIMFATVIANNYIIFPYMNAFGLTAVLLDLPAAMWNCLTLGLSGYVVGRSAEKIAKGSGIKGALDKILKGSNE